MTSKKALTAALLAGASLLALDGTALAAKSASNGTSAPTATVSSSATDEKIKDLQDQIQGLSDQIVDLKRSTGDQYGDVQNQRAKDVQVSLKGGRPTFKTADGDFSLAIRALVQYDTAYYSQGKEPAGTDFSSGNNFRRARLGVAGTLFKDWSYEFIYDFGASGTESSTISSAFIQYDGLDPVHIKIGAYAPPESFDDSTSAGDLTFLERAQPTDLARSIGGADGRDAATIYAYDDDYFAAVSYTGGVVGDAAVFDEQQSVVGRIAYRLLKSADYNFAIGADTTYTFKLPDVAAGAGSANTFRLRARPELNVDSGSIRLVDTGAIGASKVWEWGAEAAGNWQNFYGQGGYFGYEVTRRASLLADPSFNGWYIQGSWVLTGEAKPYRPERGAYSAPTPTDPFSVSHAGIGAWELAVRYSDLNLNDNPGTSGVATPTGGIRGGDQKILTAGINWYPNSAIRFVLDYQHTDVSRLSGAGGDLGAKLDAFSLRAQFAL